MVAERKEKEGWFDISTLKEPFRIEGKKTMGYELVEQLGWKYPAAVFYPTGGGVGLIGMWKAFAELEELGWVAPGKRPEDDCGATSGMRAGGKSVEQHEKVTQMWTTRPRLLLAACAETVRRLHHAGILKESGGVALAFSDKVILESLKDWAKNEEFFFRPRSGGYGGVRSFVEDGILDSGRSRGVVQYWSGIEVYGRYSGRGWDCAAELRI